MIYLGFLYRDGKGVAKDTSKAVEWFEKATAAGHPEASRFIGDLYAEGRMAQLHGEEMAESMDVDESGRFDLLDVQALLEITGL